MKEAGESSRAAQGQMNEEQPKKLRDLLKSEASPDIPDNVRIRVGKTIAGAAFKPSKPFW